jgi:hypothetical protein
LKLVTQFDALERIWGGARSLPGTAYLNDANGLSESLGTRAETENIAMRLAYIDYTSPIGLFKIGYMEDYVWGTAWGDRGSGTPAGQIMYMMQSGPFVGLIDYAAEANNSFSYNNSTSATDRGADSYRIAGIYNFKGGETGLLLLWNRDASNRGDITTTTPVTPGYLSNIYLLDPYVKVKIGPVALQAELLWFSGDARKYDYTGTTMNVNHLSAFVDATANFGMFYAGGSVAYVQGQNPGDYGNKVEGNQAPLSGGLDWNPCLIMFNTQTAAYWVGGISGHNGSVLDNEMMNAWFGQLRGGVKPIPQLDVMASVSFAQADQNGFTGTPGAVTTYPGKNYGTEIDVTGTYKITNNLSYMLGAGYFFTGDYFKGTDIASSSKVEDDFILINKLTLNF